MKIRPNVKKMLRITALGGALVLLTSCGNYVMTLNNENEIQKMKAPLISLEWDEMTQLSYGYKVQDPKIKQDVVEFISLFEKKLSDKYNVQVQPPTLHTLEYNYLTSPYAKKLFYFIDSQGRKNNVLTSQEVDQALKNIDDIL